MNESELIRKLNSVGKQSFVENYDLFQSFAAGKISRESAVELLVKAGVSNEAGAGFRLGNARQIFNAKKQNSALAIICNSVRLSSIVLAQANELLKPYA
jgi:hypothetical protein